MKVINNLIELRGLQNSVVTIGTFDGVHIGHQAIFKAMRAMAEKTGGPTVVVTFYPHPRQVLNIEVDSLRFICTQEDKIKKIEEFGIDYVVVIPFTKEFANTPSEQFITNFVVEKLHPAMLVVGYDHHFGKNRMGDYEMLCRLGYQYGFSVERIEAQDIEDVAVSSTKIRKVLSEGDVKTARELLGYPYSVSGTVVVGNRIGRTIGFPTANIEVPKEYKMINKAGVYACRATVDGVTYDAMANTGLRPTIGDRSEGDFILEVNLFNFDSDIYGHFLRVEFIDRIRDEVKFNGLEELKEQLHQDRQKAVEILKKYVISEK